MNPEESHVGALVYSLRVDRGHDLFEALGQRVWILWRGPALHVQQLVVKVFVRVRPPGVLLAASRLADHLEILVVIFAFILLTK